MPGKANGMYSDQLDVKQCPLSLTGEPISDSI
jgi:hypothetical protein